MKNFKAKNFLAALALGGTILFGGMAQPVAEAGIVTDRLPFQCYVDHQVDTYNQPNGQRVGYISANVDLIRVTQVRGDGWVYGDYPGRNGRVARWFRITELCADPSYSNRPAKSKVSQNVFRTRSSGDFIGSVSNMEDIIVLADTGNRAQILYKLNNGTGYKIGWVSSSTILYQIQEIKKGDVNNDGRVDQNDVEIMRKYIVGMVPESQISKAHADMNGDGSIDIVDMTMLIDKVNDQPQAGHNPEGTVQIAESTQPNTLHVRGTAFDEDNPKGSTRLHVYVGGGAGSGAPSYEIRTNGGNHVFDDTRNVGRSGNQHVYVYALNDYGSGENKEIWNGYVNIQGNGPTPSEDYPSSIYLTQQGNNTCTLVSAAMMLRAKAYKNGNGSWSSITESSIRSTAWSSGLKWSWSYAGMNVGHSKTNAISQGTLQTLLAQHPEGIVIHCGSLPHAVWVNGYTNGTFYCSDPLKNYSGDKRPLANSYLGRRLGSQSNILSRVTAIWYIR